MAGNFIGTIFKLSTFGESHGRAIGGVLDGCPAGLEIDLVAVQKELDRRRPGSTSLGTTRTESDTVEFLSGILDGKTLGTPIGFIIKNKDQRNMDYDALKNVYRPGHADRTWEQKYGIRDHRGGGRSSARETACRVVGGAIARQLLGHYDISVNAYVSQVHELDLSKTYDQLDLTTTFDNPVRCPDSETAQAMQDLIEGAREEKDSLGGCISVVAQNMPAGLGEPVFDKLHADLGKALFSINAVKGVEFGNGFNSTRKKGSENNDAYESREGQIRTTSNTAGGFHGGLSNGEDIVARIAFKPVSTIGKEQKTVNKQGEAITLAAEGRHDPCVLPRAVPIVEAMVCLTLADHLLRNRIARL